MKKLIFLLLNNFNTTFSLMPIIIRKKFKLVFIASLVVILFEALGFSIFIPLLDQILNGGTNQFFNFDQIFNYYEIDKKYFIGFLLFLIFIIFTIKTVILIIINKFKIRFSATIEKNISNRLVENFLHQEFEDYKKYNNSKINKELILDIGRYCAFIDSSIDLITEIFIMLIIVLLLMLVDPFSTFIIITSLLVVSSLYFILTKKTFNLLGENAQKSENRLIQSVNEISNLFKEIKIFDVEQKFLQRFKDSLNARVKHVVNYRINIFLPRVLLELFVISILVTLFFILLYTKNSTGEVFLILGLLSIASFRIMPSIVKCINSVNIIKYCDASVNIINEKLKNLNVNLKQFEEKNNEENLKLKNKIQLVNLKFGYKNSPKSLFNKVNIVINKGEHVGIIGPSGSGKSTLLDIIMQFQKEFEGEYLFDELDVKKNKLYNNKNFLKNFGYVGQNTELMNDTIRNNIIFSSAENKTDEKRLEKSIKLTQMKKFIDEQNQGLENTILDNSFNISGGQKQRLGIARALYSECPILILDEITSSLDETNQEKIMSEIEILKKDGKTIIQTTHNSKHLKYFDKVIDLTKINFNYDQK